jgi:hypothetical protein
MQFEQTILYVQTAFVYKGCIAEIGLCICLSKRRAGLYNRYSIA